jgi:hypothetical protein
MATYTCAFTIPSGQGNGAKLGGSGFGNTPTLQVNDVLQVTVRLTGQGPTSLNGYMVFSPAADVPSQTIPSPFQNNGKFVCFKSQMGLSGNNSGGSTLFTFSSFTYNGGYAGHYELTFVAEDPASGTQWSEDPEFIVEG